MNEDNLQAPNIPDDDRWEGLTAATVEGPPLEDFGAPADGNVVQPIISTRTEESV